MIMDMGIIKDEYNCHSVLFVFKMVTSHCSLYDQSSLMNKLCHGEIWFKIYNVK